ncbi:MAG TPA: hypothetical protein VNR61_13865 [Niallia sp.]|nr:hypothetical protein [Niallia sp.]
MELSYYVITRKIDFIEQIIEETEEKLILHKDKVTSAKKIFPLKTIHDISYKQSINTYKILYLHTNQGVFSFFIKDNPEPWIDSIKGRIQTDK